MEIWCVKPENKEQGEIIGKWFDENWGNTNCSKLYQTEPLVDTYYVYGLRPGDVYYTGPKGTVLTFQEFQTQILKQQIESNYEIY